MTYKEWKKYKIEDLCEVLSSKRIYAADYVSKGIPFYRSKEIIQKSLGQEIDKILCISKDKFFDIKNKYGVPNENDILISAVGERSGIPYLVKKEIFYFKDGNLIWLRNFKNKIIDSKYLCYWLKSSSGQNSLNNLMIGSAQRALTIIGIKNLFIALPPLDIQQKIAKVLSAIDDKIELNNSINNNLEQQAMALFTYNFIDNSNENRISCKAEEYFDISIGKTPPRKEPEWFSVIDGVKWVSISDMGNCGMYISNSSEYLTPSAIDKYNVKIVPDNTVILSFKLTVGRVAITVGEMTTNEAIAHFKTDNKKINEYLYCYLKKFNYQTMGSTSSIATAVNSKIIKAMLFVVPTDDEINKFHTIVKPIFNQIKLNQIENSNLIQLRDTLLPKLMSGKIDVSKVEIDDILENQSTDKLYELANESKLSAEPYNSSGSFASASKNLPSEQSSSTDKLLFS